MVRLALRRERVWEIIIVLLLCVFYGIFLTHKVSLVTADLGRHIKNGEMFFRDREVLTQNFYSYTFPNFKTINHHWASGVVIYWAYRVAGILGLQIGFILISLITFFIFFWICSDKIGYGLGGLVGLLMIPLLAQRTEIRPEMFSNLFCGIFLLILWRVRDEKWPTRYLWILPLGEILWVNLHIYFILGPVIVGAFWIESLWEKKGRSSALFVLLLTTSLVTLVNPVGLAGSLAPFNEFKNYGYELAENQSVWKMEKITGTSGYYLYKTVLGMMIVSFVLSIVKSKKVVSLASLFLGLAMAILSLLLIRNMAMFALFALPIICQNLITILWSRTLDLSISIQSMNQGGRLVTVDNRLVSLSVISFVVLIFTMGGYFNHYPYWNQFGLGLETDDTKSANFFRHNHLEGPIINNYDIGGYLIFHMFPGQRVYVDNRPEAYPASFFKDEYIPALNDDYKWQEVDKKYGFNVIFFSHLDATPWGQSFLVRRVKDKDWAVVYYDKRVIILLKRNDKNNKIIKAFEIPSNNFVARPVVSRLR